MVEKKGTGAKDELRGFKEIAPALSKTEAMKEAERCLQCQEAKCMLGCPAGINCREFIRELKENNLKAAIETILLHNPMPCVTSRVCQAYRQCQGACILAKSEMPINISGLERFVSDNTEWKLNGFPMENGKKIAIIGSGPAGLVAALELRKKGYSVKIFEAEQRVGGLLADAIPQYRLPKEITKKFLEQVEKAGIAVQTGTRIGKDLLLADLLKAFDAVLVAGGEPKAKSLKVKGNELQGVWHWNDFLKGFNEKTDRLAGKKVVVVGGGDTAIDCCRIAVRNKADVTLVYRKTEEFMPAQKTEIAEAKKEGIKFVFLRGPIEFSGEKKLKEAVFEKLNIEKEHFVMSGQEERMPCDIAVVAVGQEQDAGILMGTELEGQKLEASSSRTKLERVFAAGDLVNRNKTVVHAIRSAKEAAKDIDDFLNKRSNIPEGVTKI